MSTTKISIGQVKRDISELVNRVAYAGERIVLTSRGKPKAVIVSLEDFAQLQRAQSSVPEAWQAWLVESAHLSQQILERCGGQGIDADAAWDAARTDLEQHGLEHHGDEPHGADVAPEAQNDEGKNGAAQRGQRKTGHAARGG